MSYLATQYMKNRPKYGTDGILFLTFTMIFTGLITLLVISSSLLASASRNCGILSVAISSSSPGSIRHDFLMMPSFGKDGVSGCSIQICKSKSPHPLSKQNVRKTRPRGIPAQEPTVKPLAVTRDIQLFPSFFVASIPSFEELLSTLPDKVACRIRPPPDCCIS